MKRSFRLGITAVVVLGGGWAAPTTSAQVVTRPLTSPLVVSQNSVELDVNGDGVVELVLTHSAEDLSGPPDDVTGLFTLSLTQPAAVAAGTEVSAGPPGSLFDQTTKVANAFDVGESIEVRSMFSGELILAKHDVIGGFLRDAAGPFASPGIGDYLFGTPLRTAHLGLAFPDTSGRNGYVQLGLDPTTLEALVVGYAFETKPDQAITVAPVPEPSTAVLVGLVLIGYRGGRFRRSRS